MINKKFYANNSHGQTVLDFCLQRQYTNKIHMNAQAELLKSKGAKHSRWKKEKEKVHTENRTRDHTHPKSVSYH